MGAQEEEKLKKGVVIPEEIIFGRFMVGRKSCNYYYPVEAII